MKFDNLPIPDYDYFTFRNDFSGKICRAYTGTVFRRMSSGSLGLLFHYGFFFGVINGQTYIIHNDNPQGVECVDFATFMASETEYTFTPQFFNRKTEIMKRAMSVKDKRFSNRHFNCEHFTNYSVYGRRISLQERTVKLIENVAIELIGLGVEFTENPRLTEYFKIWRRKIVKIPKIERKKNE